MPAPGSPRPAGAFRSALRRGLRALLRKRVLLIAGGLLLGLGLTTGGLALYTFYWSDDLVFRYTIGVKDPRSGRIQVTLDVENHSKPILRLRRQAGPEHMRIFNFRALTESGEELPHRWWGPTRVIYTGFRGKVRLQYEIKPGGLGRHGHQGNLDERGGIVAGRVLFFLPRNDSDLKDFMVRFDMPTGWRAVHPWEPHASAVSNGPNAINNATGHNPLNSPSDAKTTQPVIVSGLTDDTGKLSGWFDPLLKGAPLWESLDSTTLGFGRWTSLLQTIGGNRFEAHVWDGFAPDWKQRVLARAAKVYEVLQGLFHFTFPSKFVTTFVPRAKDGKGVIAGYWSNGLGNEMDDTGRTWSLLAHRILHVLNRDHPYGMHLSPHPRYLRWKNPVNWINEGMASFFEVWATVKAGITQTDDRYNSLWEDYLKKHADGSKYVLPLARENENKDEDVTEYLHYYKAPLFTQNLDWWLRRKTGGKKTLADFISTVYTKYEKHKEAMPFYDELVAYAGVDLAWFYDKYAVDDDILLPLWDDVFSRYGQTAPQIIGQVNGEPLFADAAYQRFAGQGGAAAHRQRLIRETVLEQELRARQVEALPPELSRILPSVPPHWRTMLVRKMREELCRSLYGNKSDESERRLDEHLASLVKRAVLQ